MEGFTNSAIGVGVYGTLVGQSVTGAKVSGVGVWGDTNQSHLVAVLGSADDGYAGVFENNSEGNFTLSVSNDSPSSDAQAFNAGSLHGWCHIDTSGNLLCTGSKSAVVPVDNGTRKIALYAVEAPENWFEDAGSGQLSGGAATVTLEPTFAETVNTGVEYHVFLTPKGDCKGVYVANETPQSFEVHELSGGRSSIAFDYRIMARRKGYETIRLADKTKNFEATNLPRRNARNKASAPKLPALNQ